jgi:hypothetical protein
MDGRDWQGFDLEPLREELRATLDGGQAERLIWAFEEAVRVARIDGELLDHLLAAAVCLKAAADGTTPRHVLELFFRRSVGDEEWRERYAALLA